MLKAAPRPRINLTASAARVISAREAAALQARIVDDAAGDAGKLDVDLLYLTQENVLVMEKTHRMLKAMAALERIKRRERPIT